MNPRILGFAPCFALLGLVGLTAGCPAQPKTAKPSAMTLTLTSTAFADGQPIPEIFTCDGRDVSPPLRWNAPPAGTKSLALIADDLDAPGGIWVHWVIFDLPPDPTELPQGIERAQYLPDGARQGLNDFKRLGYGGPCPPRGKPHHYHFKLYALDTLLDLKPGSTKKEVEAALQKHVLARGELTGTYQRE